MKNSIIFLIALILITACAKRSNFSSGKMESGPVGITIVLLKILKTNNDYSITLTGSKTMEASQKNVDAAPTQWRENDFFCFVLDKRKHITDSLILVQPMHPRYEYPLENGIIGSQVMELKENEVLLRFKQYPNDRYLRIGIVEKNKRFRTVTTIALPVKI
jgi:hypothetical protein